MSAKYLVRLIGAADDLAAFHNQMRLLRAQLDWGRCLDAEDDGEGHTLTCSQLPPKATDPLASKSDCASCAENREVMVQIRVARRKRYLAMRRIIRLSEYVVPEDVRSAAP